MEKTIRQTPLLGSTEASSSHPRAGLRWLGPVRTHDEPIGRHSDRIALARAFGATDVVSERGEEAVEHVRKLTGGYGAHSVLECVGSRDAIQTSVAIARPGGAVGRVGVPHYADALRHPVQGG